MCAVISATVISFPQLNIDGWWKDTQCMGQATQKPYYYVSNFLRLWPLWHETMDNKFKFKWHRKWEHHWGLTKVIPTVFKD